MLIRRLLAPAREIHRIEIVTVAAFERIVRA